MNVVFVYENKESGAIQVRGYADERRSASLDMSVDESEWNLIASLKPKEFIRFALTKCPELVKWLKGEE